MLRGLISHDRLSLLRFRQSRSTRSYCCKRQMAHDIPQKSELEVLQLKKRVVSRVCNISSYTVEVMEIQADNPALQVLFIPGNPGVVTFYKDFVESLFELLGGTASVTAVGHISHTNKNWEHGKLFSLQDQIMSKMDFIKQELQNTAVPLFLVGHSIGAYISMEMFRMSPEKVVYFVGLYPFLALNPQSAKQSSIRSMAESLLRLVVITFLGRSWSAAAIEAACSHLVKYHTIRNILFLAKTEFQKLSDVPDWAFMRENQRKIAFLFGVDDHWGPLEMFEEIAKQVPDAALSIEREGHTHAFCCTEAGSLWVAEHVASLIKNKVSL